MDQNTIKSINKSSCPHCKEEFFVEFEMFPTKLSDVFTQEEVNEAKAEVLRTIKAGDMNTIEKENIISWVTDEKTVFGPGEVDKILRSLEGNK